MPSEHTCWLLLAFLSTDTRAALTSQSEHTFSGFMLQCNCSLCKGTSLEFAHRSVTAYCALIQCEDILYKMTWSILWCPKAVHYQHWGHYSDHPDAPLHMQCWSISSPHLCTADQSVHPIFAPLINQFTPPLHRWSISSHHLCITDQSVYTPWVLRPPQVSIMIPGDHKFVNNT